MSDVQESTAVRDGKTYGYQGQGQGEAAAADTGLEQQKQRLMTDIEAFLDSLVVRVGANAEGGANTSGTTTTTTGPSTGKGGAASSGGGAASTSGGTSSSSGQPSSTSTAGSASTGKASTGGTSGTSSGSTTTGKPATGTGSASTGTSSASSGSTTTTRPGDKPGTEATPAQREAMEKTIYGMREAFRIDRERESARLMQQQQAERAPAASVGARTEAVALKHQPDSNRAPVTESREFGPAFGTKGRGVAMTMERMSVAMEKPETVAAPGTVTTRPIDAYWASFGTAVERAAVRAQADQQTKVLLETILGTDDRTRVNNVNEYPWRCICSLLITAQNGTQYLGTGWLVAPRLVLTAGHCVYMSDEGGWAAQIEVTPGRNGDARDNGSAVSRELRSVVGWTQGNDSNCDYGAIVLPEDKRFGDTLGWFGYAVRNDDYLKQVTLNLSGYPGDGGPAHLDFTQWFMSRGVKDVMDRQITYEIDTYGGQSGSPVWEMTADGSRYGVGIHTFGTNVSNGATRVVQEVFDNIVQWAGEAS